MNIANLTALLGRLGERSHHYLSEAYAEAWQFLHDLLLDHFRDSRICILCTHRDQIEMHHVAGRRHGELLAPVCQPCHQHLTEAQDEWDPRWQHRTRDPELDLSLLIRGAADIIRRKALHVPEAKAPAYLGIASTLREQYASLGRKTV